MAIGIELNAVLVCARLGLFEHTGSCRDDSANAGELSAGVGGRIAQRNARNPTAGRVVLFVPEAGVELLRITKREIQCATTFLERGSWTS